MAELSNRIALMTGMAGWGIVLSAFAPLMADDVESPEHLIERVLQEEQIDPEQHPEFVEMLTAIARGSKMQAGEGWFHPGQSRYGWPWLAEQYDADRDGAISPGEFTGPKRFFNRLDRDRNGQVEAADLDWNDRSPFVRQQGETYRLFRRMDAGGDGLVSAEDWAKFFAIMAVGREGLTVEELQAGLYPAALGASEMPSSDVLLEGLRRGEVGSRHEGPKIGDAVPDFMLPTHDGSQSIRLSDVLNGRPVVLVFGNFTCGPWRSRFSAVEALHREYEDQADFLCVYVREAHPTDGWRMTSNDRSGVAFAQPTSNEERAEIAQQCHRTLHVSMPLLVDAVDDAVGNAYSGMPSRLYAIDPQGRIAYKSGRGPFGFKPGELEQSLVMLLLETGESKTTTSPR